MHIGFCCPGVSPEPWQDELARHLPQARLSVWQPGAPADLDFALVWMPPQAFFDEQLQLRGVFNAAAGVDALLRLRLPPDLPIVRLEDAGMGVQMAEYVCHAVMRHFRRFDLMHAQQRQGVWKQPPAPDRASYAVGVMGMGVLGRCVVQALRAFDYTVHAWTRTPPADMPPGVFSHVGPRGLPAFLAQSHSLVCLLPLTPQTDSILNRKTLAQLPRGAHVINVARGAHVVDEDLLALIDEGQLEGATLDVFRQEPLPREHAFWAHPAIRLTPHTSARTLSSRAVGQIVGKIAQAAAGTPWAQINGLVDRARGY
jgi:glyoxylate/hydroxypyruvate reductase A